MGSAHESVPLSQRIVEPEQDQDFVKPRRLWRLSATARPFRPLAPSTHGMPRLRAMSEIGVRVVIRDSRTYDDVDTCTAPGPVEPGDLVAFERGALFLL
jgi:hypothetical protein